MHHYKIIFKDIKWEAVVEGMLQKIYQKETMTIRLIQFKDTFRETEWCQKGHFGYVLQGELTIAFESHTEHFSIGEAFDILAGKESQHKVIIETNKWAELIVIDVH